MANPAATIRAAPLVVVAAALIDVAGRVLVQQRPADRAHGGLWEFPGGKVEPGEPPAAALARELAEELGIAVDPAALAPATFATGEAGERALLLLLYTARTWRGEPVAHAAQALRWAVPAALRSLPMPPADRPLVAWLAVPKSLTGLSS